MSEQMIINTMGINNCGGRCIIKAHTENGRIVKLSTDTSKGDLKKPPLTACARGMNYHRTYLDKDKRILHPLIRSGNRGEGKFRQATWDEAIDLITEQWIRIRDTFGPESRYIHYGWGVSAVVTPIDLVKHLMALDGGYLGYYNSYSNACISYKTPYMYGTDMVGSSFEDLLNSNLIVLWGHNPVETRFDSLMYYLHKAKEKNIPIICVDPRYSDTARILEAEWIPIRPTSDSALIDAMSYVIISEDLYDKEFISKYCQGFTHDTMPLGYQEEEDYFSYIFGKRDGIVKTPKWASEITGLPADRIVSFARKVATAKAAAILPGYGPQRNMNGEQVTRSTILLSCLTGNVGKSGGGSGSLSWIESPPVPEFKKAANPYKAKIPVYLWTKAITNGTEMGAEDGLTGVNHLTSNIKMIVNLAGNALINQHGDINKTAEILKDTSKCEFILCSDLFMTPSARFADVVLPGISLFEGNNMTTPWVQGNFFGAVNKVIEPLGESRFEYEWLKEIARRIGLYDEFTQGHETVDDWLLNLYNEVRYKNPKLMDYETFKKAGIYRYENLPVQIGLEKNVKDFNNNPFPTPSGKIEIFSPSLFNMNKPDIIPGIPKYVPVSEGITTDSDYPLQLVGFHTKRRCHSIHDSNSSMEAMDPQVLHINSLDAADYGIAENDSVYIYNDRGQIQIKAHLTDDIIRGTVALSQGAWYTPDDSGTDIRGNINMLTSHQATPLAHGNGQHTIRVQITKTGE